MKPRHEGVDLGELVAPEREFRRHARHPQRPDSAGGCIAEHDAPAALALDMVELCSNRS